ncbi:TauD/TfdA family dioxygenase [Aeromicrobium sp. CnD17-E]|uniref:TauD/TfdA family dioxygenase n=1 Tax=Aeromicrobium sp. CnD17-E TaxID=2954487 RepID=UPI002096CAB8|nr:TauD/TfdA family dioxygenase [Aeromicrobium sp. CnD17-E]MCO7238572.1 TauD/TfdA family dioxygenase [Aeromicrobium sp. CnD17-E]
MNDHVREHTTMERASIERIELSEQERHQVAMLATELAPAFVGGQSPLPTRLLGEAAGRLPARLVAEVAQVRERRLPHACVVSGAPLLAERLEPTPQHWREAQTAGSVVHACVLLLVADLLGESFGWASQQDGRVVTDVVPSPGQEDSLVSSSSRAELAWHTEDAYFEQRADFVGLFCLRAATGGATTVSFLDPAQLSADVVEVLQQPRFLLRPDDAHDVHPDDLARTWLVDPSDARRIRVDRDFTDAVADDPEAARALDDLVEVLDANLQDLPLAPGDIAFVDNAVAVHGRRSFTPRFDGTDRWLKRVNVRTRA